MNLKHLIDRLHQSHNLSLDEFTELLARRDEELQAYAASLAAETAEKHYDDTLTIVIKATRDPMDAALTGFVGLNGLSSTGKHPISVIIKNVGPQPVDSATLLFSINGTAQPNVSYREAGVGGGQNG